MSDNARLSQSNVCSNIESETPRGVFDQIVDRFDKSILTCWLANCFQGMQRVLCDNTFVCEMKSVEK